MRGNLLLGATPDELILKALLTGIAPYREYLSQSKFKNWF